MSYQRADATGDQYSVIFTNQSPDTGFACIYQQYPEPRPGLFSLAWLVLPVAPTTQVKFTWTLDYSFVWAQTGTLVPGVQFSASQSRDASLSTGSSVDFGQDEIGAFTFGDPTTGPTPNALIINEGDFTRPPPEQEVSIGIGLYGLGMPGQGVFAQEAKPNAQAIFTAQPQYWIAFGDYTQGQVVDVEHMTLPHALNFGSGVFSLAVTLDHNNHWIDGSTAEANAKFLKARKANPEVTWPQAQAL